MVLRISIPTAKEFVILGGVDLTYQSGEEQKRSSHASAFDRGCVKTPALLSMIS